MTRTVLVDVELLHRITYTLGEALVNTQFAMSKAGSDRDLFEGDVDLIKSVKKEVLDKIKEAK